MMVEGASKYVMNQEQTRKKTFRQGRYELISARNFIILQQASIVYSLNSRVSSLHSLSRLEKEGSFGYYRLGNTSEWRLTGK